jgi:hypothetical protein
MIFTIHRPQKTTLLFSTVQKALLTGLFVRGKQLRYVVFTSGYRVFTGDMQFLSEKTTLLPFVSIGQLAGPVRCKIGRQNDHVKEEISLGM